VLLSIAAAYHEKNGDVREQAQMVENAIAQSESFAGGAGRFSPEVIGAIVQSAVSRFDATNGGFGGAPKFPHSSAIDLVIDAYNQSRDASLRNVFVTTLEKMARGGVYDQLAGGFHRYSVDERWIVPHFEKMSYDNSELLKNYVHAWQATGSQFFADVAKDIIRWMDEWLSDREHGGFYASQDADYSMEDDGDYFTWTLEEAKSVLGETEAQVASLHYDIHEIGDMHHNPAKNVLHVRAPVEEIAARLSLPAERIAELLQSAKAKMYAARLTRPTPYVDKTVYTGWNALCVSAYLEAAKALNLDAARHFALRSLDRILSEGCSPDAALIHVIAYSDPSSQPRRIPAVLDDYAFTALACLDAYEATADLSYFNFAKRIAGRMIDGFCDSTGGGFFDTERANGENKFLGVLGARRKPFQDSPTPAGNPAAAVALLRLHAYTGESSYREKAAQTLELLGHLAGQYGIFAATYGIAAAYLSRPHSQIVIVGSDAGAQELYAIAARQFALGTAVLKLTHDQAVAPQNLPSALAETIPQLPFLKERKSAAVICAGFSCLPPIFSAQELAQSLHQAEVKS
jgi:hypothetical protein